jgi:hypothetical protein
VAFQYVGLKDFGISFGNLGIAQRTKPRIDAIHRIAFFHDALHTFVTGIYMLQAFIGENTSYGTMGQAQSYACGQMTLTKLKCSVCCHAFELIY